MHTLARAVLTGGLTGALVLASAPAQATGAGTGTLSFAGTVVIPTFPCPAPQPGEFACTGTFTASTAGTMQGLDGSSPWEVTLNSTTLGSFSYADDLDPGVPCLEGTAVGEASLDTNLDGQAFGTYQTGFVTRTVRSVAVTYSFGWTRKGAVALLNLFDVEITLRVDGLGDVVVLSGGTARAIADFVPHADSPPPSGCAGGEPTELRGSIFGDVSGIAVEP